MTAGGEFQKKEDGVRVTARKPRLRLIWQRPSCVCGRGAVYAA